MFLCFRCLFGRVLLGFTIMVFMIEFANRSYRCLCFLRTLPRLKENYLEEKFCPDYAMDWLLWAWPDGANWILFLTSWFRFTSIAPRFASNDGRYVSFICHSSSINDGYLQTNPNSIDIISGINIIKCHDNEIKLFEEGYLKFLDVFMMSFYFERRI